MLRNHFHMFFHGYCVISWGKNLVVYSSLEEWREKTVEPRITLKSYGGGKLDLTSQVDLGLSQGERHITANVFVEKGAPHQLLLRTDVQPQLGFSLVMEQPDGAAELVTGRRVNLIGDGPGQQLQKVTRLCRVPGEQSPEAAHTGVVCLPNATRIPPRHHKMVRAKVRGDVSKELSLFTLEDSLRVSDSAVELGDGNCVVLMVENHGTLPVCLKKGHDLVPATELPEGLPWDTLESELSAEEPKDGSVCHLTAGSRGTRLLEQLD